jgi:serine/threonine-protein kinase
VNTVQVWDFGHSEGLTYLVMELVEGTSLGALLDKGPMPFGRVAKIAVQVCNSLMEAHARGIVHRDLKPENLLVVDIGRSGSELQDLVKVLDFGLAKLHEDEPGEGRLTAQSSPIKIATGVLGIPQRDPNEITSRGAILGTPFYMAPEQIRGDPVDGRTDLYALGALMYRALTGVAPFVGTVPVAVLTQHLTEPLIPPHVRAPDLQIPVEASEIVGRAMAKDPDERYASAAEMRDVLLTYLARAGISGGFLRSGNLDAVAAQGRADAVHRESLPPRSRTTRMIVPASRSDAEILAIERRRQRQVLAMTILGAIVLALLVWLARAMIIH